MNKADFQDPFKYSATVGVIDGLHKEFGRLPITASALADANFDPATYDLLNMAFEEQVKIERHGLKIHKAGDDGFLIVRYLPLHTLTVVRNLINEGVLFEILSLGGGVQSSTLWLMNLAGLIKPRAEFAVFADTQWERGETYRYLEYLDEQSIKAGFPPIMRVTIGNIREDMLRGGGEHYNHMPVYTDSGSDTGGMLRRQCTGHYKIELIKREVRKVFGMHKREQWIGFSLDEIQRRNDKRFPAYITPRYPLLDMKMTRNDCLQWLIDNGHPTPIKSSCIGCPYRTDDEIAEMKEHYPEEFEDLCNFDDELRKLPLNRPKVEIVDPQLTLFPTEEREPTYELFIHSSLKPLRDVDLSKKTDPRMEQTECEGGCWL